jgi:hypothetical protein
MSELWAIDPRPSIRVPKSTEQSAVRYRDSVQSTLEVELWSSHDEFMTLLVIISNGEAETPVIMISVNGVERLCHRILEKNCDIG